MPTERRSRLLHASDGETLVCGDDARAAAGRAGRRPRGLSLRWIAPALLALPLTAAGYEEVAVSGSGTVEGRLVYDGTVPVKKIIPTKDPEVCGTPRDEPAGRANELRRAALCRGAAERNAAIHSRLRKSLGTASARYRFPPLGLSVGPAPMRGRAGFSVEPEEVQMSPTLISRQRVSGALTRVLDAAMNPSVPHDLRVELGLVASWLQQVLDHESALHGGAAGRAHAAAERSHWE